MHVISYVSQCRIPVIDRQNEIVNIVKSSTSKNKKWSVTGVLFLENDHFFQTIEGRQSDVEHVYKTIKRDNRHSDIVELVNQPIDARTFDNWSLEAFYIDNPDIINPNTLKHLRELYIHNFGLDAVGLVEFVKKMIDETDSLKIRNI